jgi:GWxTD domain-containing protein
MMANVRINLFVLENISAKQFTDSTSLTFSMEKSDDANSYLVARIFFKKPLLSQFIYKFEVVDLNRTSKSKKYIYCSDNTSQSNNSFLTILSGSSFPLFSTAVTATDSFHLYNSQLNTDSVYLRFFKRNYMLAAPPQAENATVRFSYVADSTIRIAFNDTLFYNFSKKGIYHLQADTMKKIGYTLFNFGDDYPIVTKPAQMIGPIRYLTTKNEYSKIVSAENTIDAIEQFWIERAGNKTLARKLISAYYNRVEFANKNYTSYTEGWKTDRGMISIVYGKPDFLEYKDKQEVWTYLNAYEGQSLDFVFTKINNPFTENDFILIRSQRYEIPWFTAVDSWRNGHEFGR